MSKKRKGSMAVEAALVLPLFIFAMANLNSFMELYEVSLKTSFKLYEEVRVAAAGSHFFDELGIDLSKNVMLFKTYAGKPVIDIMGYDEIPLVSVFTAKPWNGYFGGDEKENISEEELVYITPSGDAYHSSPICPYLKLSIQLVDISEIDFKRNMDGEMYTACSKCGDMGFEGVYITNYGNQYHTTLECSSLKRTILEIPFSQVENRHSCQKCYGG